MAAKNRQKWWRARQLLSNPMVSISLLGVRGTGRIKLASVVMMEKEIENASSLFKYKAFLSQRSTGISLTTLFLRMQSSRSGMKSSAYPPSNRIQACWMAYLRVELCLLSSIQVKWWCSMRRRVRQRRERLSGYLKSIQVSLFQAIGPSAQMEIMGFVQIYPNYQRQSLICCSGRSDSICRLILSRSYSMFLNILTSETMSLRMLLVYRLS